MVPLDLPGVQRTRYDDVGSAIVGRGSVFFDDVRIPLDHRVGDEGRGFTQVMQGFDYSRVLIALQCLAAAQASIDEAWRYVRERQTFGLPLAQYQGVTFPLVEAETLVAATRQLCYHALELRDAGRWSNGSARRPRSTRSTSVC
jgi:cyclohexanecarboxyl-CoA dehydrogenase